MKIQLVSRDTRIYIGKEFDLDYRLAAGDEVYYESSGGDDYKFDDTVWTVVFCRSESYMPNRQLVFVLPLSLNSTEALK
jgi:hypothetical protein